MCEHHEKLGGLGKNKREGESSLMKKGGYEAVLSSRPEKCRKES